MKATPGTAITARPWSGGQPLPLACRGVVLETWNGDSGDVLVWFPSRGGPDEPGRAVQPILAHEVETARPLTACPPSWVAEAYRALRRVGALPDLPTPVRRAFDTALRHHTQPTR